MQNENPTKNSTLEVGGTIPTKNISSILDNGEIVIPLPAKNWTIESYSGAKSTRVNTLNFSPEIKKQLQEMKEQFAFGGLISRKKTE
jgi:hypothetical protein